MTPKDKARELVNWFMNADFNCKECEFVYCDIKCTQLNIHEAKQCALKCVGEIIGTGLLSKQPIKHLAISEVHEEYYIAVKEEIEKM